MIERKAVLVTGASSGIGRVTARVLAQRGFRIFAGVRSAVDAQRVAAEIGPRCTPIQLDVADAASIATAADAIRVAGGVYGLVNNAGIATLGPLECIPLDELRRQFEVNVIGAIAVSQAMLPLLRRSLGRIVNVGSVSGRFALPIAGPYAGSKAALDATTQALRMELAPFDIGVSYIEAGPHRTPIWDRSRGAADALQARLPSLAWDYYGPAITALHALMSDAERHAADPQRVSAAIAHALEAAHPRPRYLVGVGLDAVLLRSIPERAREWAIAKRFARAADASLRGVGRRARARRDRPSP